MIGRIVIDDVRPRTPSGAFPAKAVVGQSVEVSADVFRDGHDVLGARLAWRPRNGVGTRKRTSSGKEFARVPMRQVDVGLDRWAATFEPTTLGFHELVVEAWTDVYATWRHKAEVKLGAGQDIDVELAEGVQLVEQRLAEMGDGADGGDRGHLETVLHALRDEAATQPERIQPAFGPTAARLLSGPGMADHVSTSEPHLLWVDRERALFSAWYELFPRSEGGFQGVLQRLPAVADLGFDVVYFPPIHPIGRSHRKGPNNTLTAGPDDPGSPWAIGGAEGGHTDIHPDLGTFTDFEQVVERAHELGMEIALDYALQCSPDHPWVHQHPEWFHHRPDGSIAYAENPPKKYQDIYPINFWPGDDADRQALWDACRDILTFWIGKGVRIFRVDNPHTKPMAFWAWVIAEVQRDHPDVIFLAEAFTRPKVMAKLAEVGFSQSYTYFTWRTASQELTEYVEEVSLSPKADYMRPNFWPNTPDILSGPLRHGPPAAFKLRFLLAATLVPSYGIYSGYELFENEPMSDQNEEYFHSEKYEIRQRDWSNPHNMNGLIRRVNEIRQRHPALQRLGNVHFHHSDNPNVLVWSKVSDDGGDVVLMCVNLDPWNMQETTLSLDLGALGIPWDSRYEAYDELTRQAFQWWGAHPYVRLDPHQDQVGHILHLRPFA